jgi:hypothetical protein
MGFVTEKSYAKSGEIDVEGRARYKRREEKRRYLISEYRPSEFYGLPKVQIYCRLTAGDQCHLAGLQRQVICFARRAA